MSNPSDLTVEQLVWEKDFDLGQTLTAGVEDQVHEFLYRIFDEFEDAEEGPRMTIFLKVWKEASFALIFHGRESFRELYEFTEEMFDIVKQYATQVRKKVENPQGLRYAALYLLYALYFKQPCRPKVKIRLTLEEFREMQEDMEEAKESSHSDVVYAWAKLFSEGAFHYVAAPGQLGIELAYQLEQKQIEAKKPGKPCKNDFFASGRFRRLMQKVTTSHEKYENLKRELAEANPEDTNVIYTSGTDSEFPATLLKIVEGEESSEEINNNREQKEDIGEKRIRIKNKYYSCVSVESHRDHLFAEGRKKANSRSEDGTGRQIKDEILCQLNDELEDDRVPFIGKPRSKLRGKNRRKGMGRERNEVKVFKPSLDHIGIGLDELEISSEDVDGNLLERQVVKRERGKHGRKHEYRETGRTLARDNDFASDKNCNASNTEYAFSIVEGSGAGPSGVSSVEKIRGRGKKISGSGERLAGHSVGVYADPLGDRGHMEEPSCASGKVGGKMERVKVKKKSKKGMWGNAARSSNNHQQQMETQPVFRFHRNTE